MGKEPTPPLPFSLRCSLLMRSHDSSVNRTGVKVDYFVPRNDCNLTAALKPPFSRLSSDQQAEYIGKLYICQYVYQSEELVGSVQVRPCEVPDEEYDACG